MSSRTRARTVKTAAGVTTVRIPRQRGRRSADPFVVVIPERPTLTRLALDAAARWLWKHRRALAPLALGVLALPITALLHVMAWWSALVLAPAAAGPLLWLGIAQRRRPAANGSVWGLRIAAALLGTSGIAWAASAAGFGPLAGPLELWWLLNLIAAQTTWLIVRRTAN
ncbi:MULTISPECIES: hypothetical protein [Streptomyces violaceusniger group]|uniref:Membrane protein n=2 Tax=Streptomyces rapamycinicus TaxID=1226757 RepID=A0A0A0NIK5_STRRN|nr:hypothetical protein [Streptomyces rapamycinicus]AGP55888.1 membrane protein [Streptomyces rapamycinicus NRRL 5491]MBB4783475.1 hypothetical protein [Streptomyces rapamycinicus]RLV81050.1 membrane protein [Streptomyces rapamycinicus NRRL 5491]UTO63866.1 hypothetical protein LJB45_17055 [Streptomyces rapamycinicus]UTP31821.1 hypothetical protein LIV37_22170 [Streptomyces rapamycinicus NRRL 5491]